MKDKDYIFTLTPEGRHLPEIYIDGQLEKHGLKKFWEFADEVCDSKEFEKIAQLIVLYMENL